VERGVWPRIAVMGAGAVGCYFGGMLARAGAPVTLISRARHVEALQRDGLLVETLHFRQQIPIAASSDVRAAQDADIVLFCVKAYDTAEAAHALAPHLRSGALVLSLQNGVDNADRIRSAAKIEAIPAVVYVAVATSAPARIRHSGRGDLIIGELPGGVGKHDLSVIAAIFERASIPCLVSGNIEADLWTKMIMNCAYNAISALGRSQYGPIVQNPWTRDVMTRVTEEAIAVACAAGVRLPEGVVEAVLKLADTMSQATSSTAQDIARGSRTEIDSLNGYVVRLGAQLGIATSVNQTLHGLVKLLEESTKT